MHVYKHVCMYTLHTCLGIEQLYIAYILRYGRKWTKRSSHQSNKFGLLPSHILYFMMITTVNCQGHSGSACPSPKELGYLVKESCTTDTKCCSKKSTICFKLNVARRKCQRNKSNKILVLCSYVKICTLIGCCKSHDYV